MDGIKISHTLQVRGFAPQEEQFQKYISQFGDNDEYKHMEIAKHTVIKDRNGHEIDVEELEVNKMISFTVKIMDNDYNLLAVEIQQLE